METILVTGTGGGVGMSILKSLQGSRYRVIAADGEELGTGLYVATKGYRIPYANRPDYVASLLNICRMENCVLVFPGLDAELPVLAAEKERFAAAGVQVIVSSPGVVEISDDKLATAEFLLKNGFPAPLTQVLEGCQMSRIRFPAILKPRRGGARSLGVLVVRDEQELRTRMASVNAANYVVQEQIMGDEYTCGTINLEGRCQGTIVMRRILRDGDTYKAFVVRDSKLTDFVVAVADALKPLGACNFQLRLREGVAYVFEFNARCSGTTYCRTLAGFNEPLMIADFLLRGAPPSFQIREISVLRYWQELVVDNSRLREMKETGQVSGDGSQL